MSRKFTFFGLLAAVIAALILATTAAASGILTVRDPAAAATGRGSDPGIPVPRLLPGGQPVYAPHEPGQLVAHRDGRRVAQLASPPVELQALRVWMLDQPTTVAPDAVAFTVLSSLEYTLGNKQHVLVTTAQPSAAATQRALSLGNDAVPLPNGVTGWLTTGIPGQEPNQIAFAQDGLIVTLAGDVPVGLLRGLAAQVVVR